MSRDMLSINGSGLPSNGHCRISLRTDPPDHYPKRDMGSTALHWVGTAGRGNWIYCSVILDSILVVFPFCLCIIEYEE